MKRYTLIITVTAYARDEDEAIAIGDRIVSHIPASDDLANDMECDVDPLFFDDGAEDEE